jgi:hypothetical protein
MSPPDLCNSVPWSPQLLDEEGEEQLALLRERPTGGVSNKTKAFLALRAQQAKAGNDENGKTVVVPFVVKADGKVSSLTRCCIWSWVERPSLVPHHMESVSFIPWAKRGRECETSPGQCVARALHGSST